ncbi:DNA helicase RecG [Candidatus Gracilibacteria bacterium CG17_big_fil_post_rev_8_21_14_2_50_48_13]|nr:MAG: DNA helicase RecG [Candidatus Gracilibacteria bacterium CG17_big_fil_post_rev_8_21_14_2_50_48_13]
MKLGTPLRDVLATTPYFLKTLEKAGLSTLEDLLLYFPRTYEDRSIQKSLARANLKDTVTVQGILVDKDNIRTKRGYKLLKALFRDEEGNEAEVVWFNQPHLMNMLTLGKSIILSGKLKYEQRMLSFQSPTFEYFVPGQSLVHFGGITPIYPEIDRISTEWLRKKMHDVAHHALLFEETLPEEVRKSRGLMGRGEAIRELHMPTSREQLERARYRLGFEELFLLQLAGVRRKLSFQRDAAKCAPAIPLDAEIMKEFVEQLPFQLTDHQRLVTYQILRDMERDVPMQRLVEGDVGSGKTLVAVLCAYHAIRKGGVQAAIMAPTEVLASQHYKSITALLAPWGLNVQYLAGSLTKKEKETTALGLAQGTVDVVIGTHALIQEYVQFHRLGLVVIDEQHRFGVEQRRTLAQHGFPHVLHMTATPIPRTLALTMYGDQDISLISEMPKGRKTIITRLVNPQDRQKMYYFLEDQVRKGRQAFVICPLIDESEKLEDVRAVTKEYAFLQEHIFPELKIGLLHGKMKAEEKEQIMTSFKDRKFDILVSTSVIEVGVDIPNASTIVIEGAERFGLSQLHQFRGRVGRGEAQSYCFLATDSSQKGQSQRLKAMEKYADGFRLSEIDLELRGPGEVYGIRQSGVPDLRVASLTDLPLIVEARELAEEILEKDLDLNTMPVLKRLIDGDTSYIPE